MSVLAEIPRQLRFSDLLRDASHLDAHLDGPRRMAHRVEGPCEESERVEVLRVGRDARLQLRDRAHRIAGIAAQEVLLGGEERVLRIGPEVQEAFEYSERIVRLSEFEERACRDSKLGQRVGDPGQAAIRLREASMKDRVVGLERRHLLKELRRFDVPPVLFERERGLVVVRELRALLGYVGAEASHAPGDRAIRSLRFCRKGLDDIEEPPVSVARGQLPAAGDEPLRYLRERSRHGIDGAEPLFEPGNLVKRSHVAEVQLDDPAILAKRLGELFALRVARCQSSDPASVEHGGPAGNGQGDVAEHITTLRRPSATFTTCDGAAVRSQ